MFRTIWQHFKTEMLKYKYIHNILQQNKFKIINIFGFDIVWCSAIERNVVFSKYGLHKYGKKWIISGISRKFSTFATKIWILHPQTVILFLLVYSCRKIKWEQTSLNPQKKIRTVSLSQNFLGLNKIKKKCRR